MKIENRGRKKLKGIRKTVRFSEDLYKDIEDTAQDKMISSAELIRFYVENGIKSERKNRG